MFVFLYFKHVLTASARMFRNTVISEQYTLFLIAHCNAVLKAAIASVFIMVGSSFVPVQFPH